MKIPTMPVPSRRVLVWGAWTVGVLIVGIIIWMMWLLATLQDDVAQGGRDRDALRDANAAQDATIAAQESALEQANRRLRDAGEAPVLVPEAPEPVPGPAGAAGEPGARGPAGPPGASIIGPRGPAGRDGRTVVGPPGPAGDDGDDGDDGATITGPKGDKGDTGAAGKDGRDGKDATPEMVDTAVVRYCSVRGECAGPQGPPGPEGPAGPAGPAGPQGGPGVVHVVTQPACGDLMPNMAISLAYDPATQTLTLVCS